MTFNASTDSFSTAEKDVVQKNKENSGIVNNQSPLVSMLLLAYNQEDTIRKAIQSCLDQTYSPLEIIMSDDCSADKTFQIMQEMAENYHGPHKIILNRNQKNYYIGPHYNKAIELASGEILLTAAGDDMSYPERVATVVEEFQKDPDLMWLFSNVEYITDKNENTGVFSNYSTRDCSHEGVLKNGYVGVGASAAFREKVWSYFGCLNRTFSEDSIFVFRAALLGKVKYLPKVLVKYRGNGVSNKSVNFWTPSAERTNFSIICQQQQIADLQLFLTKNKEKSTPELLNALRWNEKKLKRKLILFQLQLNFPHWEWKALLPGLTFLEGRRTIRDSILARFFPKVYQKIVNRREVAFQKQQSVWGE